jgi:hypothetical protein
MTTSAASNPLAPTTQAAARRGFPLFAAGGLGLLGSELLIFAGTIWDIQWHQDVGPDTFFTVPHLLIYSGATFAGLSCLAVVLACTRRARQPDASNDPAVIPILRRTFWAPPGFILAGLGASLWLVFGLYDQWWHRVYGFDVTLTSPPHTGLSLADITTLVGCISVFTLLVARSTAPSARPTWPAICLATATSILLTYSFSFYVYTYDYPWIPTTIAGVLDGPLTLTAAFYAFGLLLVVSVVRRPSTATLTALVFTVLCIGTGVFSAWATPAYATASGLFLRDDAVGFPTILVVLPKFVLPAGVLIDLVLAVGRRRGWPIHRGVLVAAGAGTLALVGLEALLLTGVDLGFRVASPLATTVASGAVGAAAGWGGWKTGVVLRQLATSPSSPTRTQEEGGL